MPKQKMLPPVCFCEYCNEKYFEFPKDGTRLINQYPGLKARAEHYKVCHKVPINVVGRVMKSTEANCPVCGLIMRVDTILRHCAAKHAYTLSLCMRNDAKAKSKKHRCPIVIGYTDRGDTDVLKVCLVCKKGYTDGSVHKEGFEDMRYDHKECCKEFDKYKDLFEPSETLMDLPFSIHAPMRKVKSAPPAVIVPGDIITAAPAAPAPPPVVIVPGDIKPLGGAGTALDADELDELERLRKLTEILESQRDELRQRLLANQTAAVKDNMKELMKALSFAMTMEEDTMEEIDDMIEYVKGIDETINSAVKDAKKPLYRKIADLEKKVADYESGREVARLKDRVKELMEDRRQTAVFEGTMVKLGYRGKPIDSDSD